jgi:phosphoglycolate phosphatase
MLRQATIVFDLDGTLVDTAPALSNALNDVMTRRGHAPVPVATVRACVGHGARVMIEQALRQAGAADDVDQMLAEFLIHYEANIAAESRPFPGAVTALESLADRGATLAVCTNKREYCPGSCCMNSISPITSPDWPGATPSGFRSRTQGI